MKRSLKFSLSLANTNKLESLDKLAKEYKATVNYFLKRLFNKKGLSEEFLKLYQSPLSYRYKQCAKRQAFKMFKSWCRNKKKGDKPKLRNLSLILDYRFLELQESKNSNSFDYWLKIATLNKGKPILIPIKSYNYAKQYFNHWQLLKGGRLLKQNNNWFLELTFQKETPSKKEKGKVIAIDIGIKKLMVTSEGQEYGKDIERLMDKIQRKKQGSKAFYRALKERDYYINKIVKTLNWNKLKTIIMENIKNIKQNTKKERRLRKLFRSKFQRWTYSQLLKRIKLTAEATGVHLQLVNPAHTSQTCSKCGAVHKLNRICEIFKCRNCGYTQDADYNASLNILNLGLAQQFMVAGSTKALSGIYVH
jgi:putative transposase